jgi:hypothetical protein
MWSFGIFYPFWYIVQRKNLATLLYNLKCFKKMLFMSFCNCSKSQEFLIDSCHDCVKYFFDNFVLFSPKSKKLFFPKRNLMSRNQHFKAYKKLKVENDHELSDRASLGRTLQVSEQSFFLPRNHQIWYFLPHGQVKRRIIAKLRNCPMAHGHGWNCILRMGSQCYRHHSYSGVALLA